MRLKRRRIYIEYKNITITEMATLQKIRSKGTLLLIVIGAALLAFILGDAWKILRPNQGVVMVGEINGESVTAQDYQKELEKYSDALKFQNNISSFTDDQYNAVKDEVWNYIIRKSLLDKESKAIGLKVTDAEIEAVIQEGNNTLLRQTPFQNPQTGAFDVDNLMEFLAAYKELDRSQLPAEYLNNADQLYSYWCFIEDNLRQNRYLTKYLSILEASLVTNPISRKDSYETRAKRADILLATLPYSQIPDSLAGVTASDVQKLYNGKKQLYKQDVETRDISYIDVEILPSEADRAALLSEVTGYAVQLSDVNDEFASFIRLTESAVPFSEVPRTKDGLPDDVAARLDSVNGSEVYGPYYNVADDSYNAFRILSTVNGYDSIQYSQIQVVAATPNAVEKLADSIYNAVLKGEDMMELGLKYSQNATPQWISSAAYETAALSGDNATYVNTLNSMKKGEVRNLKLDQATLILKVTDLRNPVKKYNTAVVKRYAYFSNETSNDAYNKLSAFVACNITAELLNANAEDNGFRLLNNPDFTSYSHTVGGVSKSHDALRWVFDAKPGEVSRLYEVGEENDHLLVVALNGIHKKGYRPIDDVKAALQTEALKDKKAGILFEKFAGCNTASALRSVDGVRIDTVKYVNFISPSYISSTFSSEPLIGAAVYNLENGSFSAPVKGEGGVWVAGKVSDDTYASEYDDKDEAERIKSQIGRVIANGVLQELYNKADVEDTRYKNF